MSTKSPMPHPSSPFLAAVFLALALLAVAVWVPAARAALPEVTNVRASQRPGTKLVDIYYDLADADGNASAVFVLISADSGASWNVPARTFTGDVDTGVAPGRNKHVVWNAGEDWDGQFTTRCRARVMAFEVDRADVVQIPAGSFQMGDTFGEGGADERPMHSVSVSAFYLERTEVSKALWDPIYLWALIHAYTFDNPGSAKGPAHPVHSINWYDAVKWCNARSEFEGRTPVYYTDSSLSLVYRSGHTNVQNAWVKWNANGYRLPTEAEWEKAARGGLVGKRFPHGNTITHHQANYASSAGYFYDTSPTRGYHPDYQAGGQPCTSPVGSFPPNDFGLYDMAGNLWEWCWDWYRADGYSDSQATQSDPKGPGSGIFRVLRGGAWNHSAYDARCARRINTGPSDYGVVSNFGFRCGRGF